MFMLSVKQGNCFQALYALYALHAFIALAKLYRMPVWFTAP